MGHIKPGATYQKSLGISMDFSNNTDTNFTLIFTLQCELTDDQSIKSESSILMTIANKASVDFKEFFGTVTSVADQEFDITCEAEKSRPPGKFSWRIELASSEIINLKNDLSPKEKPGANGFYRTEEVKKKYFQKIAPQA